MIVAIARTALFFLLVWVTTTSCYDPEPEQHGPFEEPFAQAERAVKEATDEYNRWLALTGYLLVAVDHVPNDRVRESAAETLQLAQKYRDDWNYGNAVHKANLALGRIALREGDVAASKDYLLLAGETPGSPQLNSFGPNMILAKELFARGERQVLIDYFTRCDRFWELDLGNLRKWSNQVKSGVEPDFGPNLVY